MIITPINSIFLIKEAEADGFSRNKFGYTPSDIAQNFEIRKLFGMLLPQNSNNNSTDGGSMIEE